MTKINLVVFLYVLIIFLPKNTYSNANSLTTSPQSSLFTKNNILQKLQLLSKNRYKNYFENLQNSRPFYFGNTEKVIFTTFLNFLYSNENQIEHLAENKKKFLSQLMTEVSQKMIIEHRKYDSYQQFLDDETEQWPSTGDFIKDYQKIINSGITLIIPEFRDPVSQNLWDSNEKNKKDFWSKLIPESILSQKNLKFEALHLLLSSSAFLYFDQLSYKFTVEKLNDEFMQFIYKTFALDEKNIFARVPVLLVRGYFLKSNQWMRLNFLSDLMNHPLPLSVDTLIKSLFITGGPNLQKAAQVLAEDERLEPRWKNFFKEFQSGVRQVPFWQVQDILSEAQFPFKIIDFQKKPLGTGSIAQTHLGTVEMSDGTKKEMVFRFIKPGVKEYAEIEKEVILSAFRDVDEDPMIKAAKLPKFEKLAESVFFSIKEDLNLIKSTQNQSIGKEVYTRPDIDVPEVYLSLEEDPLFMIQTKADGKKITKYSEDIQMKSLARIFEIWIEESIFKSGYFHADLHQGNYFVEKKLRKLLFWNYPFNAKMKKTFIDFGMFFQLSKEDQLDMISLGIAISNQDLDRIGEILWSLSKHDPSGIGEQEFLKLIKKEFSVTSNEVNSGENSEINVADININKLLKVIAQSNINFKNNVMVFLRGLDIVNTQFMNLNNQSKLLSILMRIVVRNPYKAITVLKKNNISVKDIFVLSKKLLFSKNKNEFISLGNVEVESKNKALFFGQCISHYY